MNRFKWPIKISSIMELAKEKLKKIARIKPIKRITKLPKMAVLTLLIIIFLTGANSLFWWYRATHGGFQIKNNDEEYVREWIVEMDEGEVDEARPDIERKNLEETEDKSQNDEIASLENLSEKQKEEQEKRQEEEQKEKTEELKEETDVLKDEKNVNTAENNLDVKNSVHSSDNADTSYGSNDEKVVSTMTTMAMPAIGKLIKGFAMESLVYSKTLEQWSSHSGIDIAADIGSHVKAAMDGTVKEVREKDPRLGVVVVIDHGNGIQTLYGNLQSGGLVKEGDKVIKGQVIGAVGKTAPFEIEDPPHLHFEVLKDGEHIDPQKYLPDIGNV